MITTKTPLRVSFLGGGSDYESYFSKNTGYVLGTTINQHVYVSVLGLPKFAEEKFRFTYRITESVQQISDFAHPVVRSSLSTKRWSTPINLATMSDLPGRSGLGSSSSFTVGLELALATFKNESINARELAKRAIQIERIVLGEAGGLQDQYQAAVGGFKLYQFSRTKVDYTEISDNHFLTNSMVLVPMSDWRDSHNFANLTENKIRTQTGNRLVKELAELAFSTFQKLEITENHANKLTILGEAVNYGWNKKIELAGGTIEEQVIDVISQGIRKGALAGRLCGAGGTGFVLFLVPPENRDRFIETFENQKAFGIESSSKGSEILLHKDLALTDA